MFLARYLSHLCNYIGMKGAAKRTISPANKRKNDNEDNDGPHFFPFLSTFLLRVTTNTEHLRRNTIYPRFT